MKTHVDVEAVLSSDTLTLRPELRQRWIAFAVLGVLGLGGGLLLSLTDSQGLVRFQQSYLVAFSYLLTLTLGGLFFVILQHLARASWSVVFRRLAEFVIAGFPLVALMSLPIFVDVFNGGQLYHAWIEPEGEEASLIEQKRPYLNVPFFLGRLAFYLFVWTFLARFFVGNSLAQDKDGDVAHSQRSQWYSYVSMILFALTTTFASFDLLMSLSPVWFSTIFGVYIFAGCAVSIHAFLAIIMLYLQSGGYFNKVVREEHYHDVGKFLFGFVFFWSYVAFSQYMLIWYGDIPEETFWYYKRSFVMQGENWYYISQWGYFGLILLAGHCILPFLGLLGRWAKRLRPVLGFWALWLLLFHYVDLYYIIMPTWYGDSGKVPFGLVDVALFVGMVGVFLANFFFQARHSNLLPIKDPRLEESLTYRNWI